MQFEAPYMSKEKFVLWCAGELSLQNNFLGNDHRVSFIEN